MSDDAIITLLEEDTEKGMMTIIDLYGDSVKTICCAILSGFSYEDIQEAISGCICWSLVCDIQRKF